VLAFDRYIFGFKLPSLHELRQCFGEGCLGGDGIGGDYLDTGQLGTPRRCLVAVQYLNISFIIYFSQKRTPLQ